MTDLHENETACRTHFHMKGFALRLVLKQAQENSQMAYFIYCTRYLGGWCYHARCARGCFHGEWKCVTWAVHVSNLRAIGLSPGGTPV